MPNTLRFMSPRRVLIPMWIAILLMMSAPLCGSASAGGLLKVLYPDGGDNLVIDSTANIRWLAQGVTSQIRIEFSADSGFTWTTIATVAARPGFDSAAWKVTGPKTTKAFVRLTSTDGTNTGRSARTFTIVDEPVPSLALLYPDGGEFLGFDSTISIRWQAKNVTGDLTAELSADSGSTWSAIGTARPSDGSLAWKIPHTPTTRALVRIRTADNAVNDVSTKTFSIKAQVAPMFRVIYPNGGEVFASDSMIRVRWQSQDLAGQLQAEYSSDQGATWKTIGIQTLKQGIDSLTWKVAGDSTTTALIRVGLVQGSLRDVSDAPFTIKGKPGQSGATIVVIYPKGGEKLGADSTVQVRWLASGAKGTLTVRYSPNNGLTWQTIGSREAISGVDVLAWRVPVDVTQAGLIRVETADGTASGTSSASFSVVPLTPTSVDDASSDPIGALRLIGCYPNPSASGTDILWRQSVSADVSITIHDARGAVAGSIAPRQFESGSHRMALPVAGLPSGSYVYELRSGSGRLTGMMEIVR